MDVVVDCDPGIDDAVALAYLAGEGLAGRVRLTGVTTVHGNVDVSTTGRNAAFVLDRLGLADVPVHLGSAEPLTPLGYKLDSTEFHGADGLGGMHDRGGIDGPGAIHDGLRPHRSKADNSNADGAHTDPTDGTSMEQTLAMLANSAGSGRSLLALGPLTNVASWLGADPSAVGSLERLVVMGGAFGHPPGNVTSLAEFNFHVDGVAAAQVMASGALITLVPLDVTEQVLIRSADLIDLSDSPGGRMLRRLLTDAVRLHERRTGVDGCVMHDALAAAVLVDPSLVECTTGRVTVDTEGSARGHAELEPDLDGPVRVALGVDVRRARDQLIGSLARL